MKKLRTIFSLGLLVVVLAVGIVAFPAGAADHLEAPMVRLDGRIDINDVYVFHPIKDGQQDLSRTTFVMTVNPAAGVISGESFRHRAKYEFMIDHDGDTNADLKIRTKFEDIKGSSQQKVRVKLTGEGVNRVIARGLTEEIIEDDGVKVFAGTRDDPFFFDNNNFNNGATFCGTGLPVSDFFKDLKVSALVVEMPTAMIGYDKIGVWGRTIPQGSGQADRMGFPAINTVFIPPNPFEAGSSDLGNLEDQFNNDKPKDDQKNWRDEVVNSLTLLFSLNDGSGDDPSDDAATIQAIADILLPDILPVDLTKETDFSMLNGRNLADDVIDTELALITEGLITTDCVDNSSNFLDDFPYLSNE